MEILVESPAGIPEGSVLSIRAGTKRLLGDPTAKKPLRFDMSLLDANPFTLELLKPLARKRLTLRPKADTYAVMFDPLSGIPADMSLNLTIKETTEGFSKKVGAEFKPGVKQKMAADTQAYIDEHQFLVFLQNLIQSVLVEKPQDPFEYMENHLRAARLGRAKEASSTGRRLSSAVGAPRGVPSAPTSPVAVPKKKVRAPKENLAPIAKTFDGPALVVQNGLGAVLQHRNLTFTDLTGPQKTEVRRLLVHNLKEHFTAANVSTPLKDVFSVAATDDCNLFGCQAIFFEGSYPKSDERVAVPNSKQLNASNASDKPVVRRKGGDRNRRQTAIGQIGEKVVYYQMLRAGPRQKLHFNPQGVVATIVTCGGLCPGLNAVIRELTIMLHSYGVKRVWGIRGGFKGVVDPRSWVELTPETVQDIHNLGGSILVSDRGNPEESEQAEVLKAMGVRQHFIVGGDGAHAGAHDMHETLQEMDWECAVVGVPKTIDNDIPMVDRTFGFDTACTEAIHAINTAYVESSCNESCIGLVKVMGRSCGFIALNACLAALNVDICLLPEMEICLGKLLEHCIGLMQTKGRAVIVVAEGCGAQMTTDEGEPVDDSAHVDVGLFLKEQLLQRFKQVRLPLSIKYIDPTYMVRAVKPNANDSVYCTVLSHNAVHAAMAGYSAVTIGCVHQRYCILPIQAITMQPKKKVDTNGRQYTRLMTTTLQADFTPNSKQGSETIARRQSRLVLTKSVVEGLMAYSEVVEPLSSLSAKDELRRLELSHLSSDFGTKEILSPFDAAVKGVKVGFFDEHSWATQALGGQDGDARVFLQMLRAGPRRVLHFQPDDVAAAIITCGGLCPGLNSVIREIVMILFAHGVRKVYGIKGGYKGVVQPQTWLTLTPEGVKDIHMQGGTILTSDRGNPTEEEQFEYLKAKGIRQYFIIGGDGTHLGAMDMADVMKAAGWECAVIGIPKTIDNDLPLLDRTFGFDTAMTEAKKAIDVAYTEATCNANCIGLVKLMGRHCGWLTMMSVLAARHVDICLLPEMDINLGTFLDYSVQLVSQQGYAVIVIAEGCGETLMQSSGEFDAGGNKKLPDVGVWIKESITDHFKKRHAPVTIKYVDPTYSVRAVPANANDSIYCCNLAAGAVHAAMAGYTNVTVAKIDETFVYLPIKTLVSLPNKKVDLSSPWFDRLLATTKQPNLGMVAVRPYGAEASAATRPRTEGGDILTVPDCTLTVYDGYGEVTSTRPLERTDLLCNHDQIRELKCFHLSQRYGTFRLPTPLKDVKTNIFQDGASWTTQAMYAGNRVDSGAGTPYYQMVRAGPREFLHFDPCDPASCAAIVSCGGICPGLNPVIRELVMMLDAYGVKKIWGVIGGYKGVMEPEKWIRLTPELVQNIHQEGGTMLISDRGNPPHMEMAKVLKAQGVRQYFVLGGDGTHKGVMQTFDACQEIGYECALIGVPKTIDNDVPLFDQTFGFDSACAEAIKAVDSAYVEARCNANCIGLVKLMGRHCGFIALNAALAARNVDLVLLPEMSIDLEKVLEHCLHLMHTQGHAVIIVAEGCGDTLIESEGGTDAGGNKILADVGPWLKDKITARFKQQKLPLTIKYIDPTYMIRSIPANAFDSSYCSALAQNAVHGAMAGYSGITVGKVYERYVYVPIYAITKQKGKRVNPKGRWFNRLLETTKQPDLSQERRMPTPKASKEDTDALLALSVKTTINAVLNPGDHIKRLECVNLGQRFTAAMFPNRTQGAATNVVLDANAWSTQTFAKNNSYDDMGHTYYQLLRSGPREDLHFDPSKSCATIVTCGGLCPGLNSVIREIVMTLYSYGVTKVYGCVGGYKGMVQPETWIELTPDVVRDIHEQGGTILVSDRGNPPHPEIAKTLKRMNVTQYFVIGGDGTHQGAMDTFSCLLDVDHECAVVGIPKTIDNDIPILDKSFGFNTACTEAEKAIDSAYVEANCKDNCIGLVKLMGRHCGFIAMEATLAARNVDICLLPEMAISLPKVLTHALNLVKRKKHCVIVVAEGCGDTLLQSAGGTDAGGNKVLADVGPWLMEQLHKHFKSMHEPLTIRYIDPTYMIRAVRANANDTVYCSVLAQHAVHGAMAGYTGITVGKVDERYVMLPIHAITKNRSRKVDLTSRIFERLVHTTGQPDLSPSRGDDWALMPKPPPPPPEDDNFNEILVEPPIPEEAGPPPDDQQEFENATLSIFDGFGTLHTTRALARNDVMHTGDHLRKLIVPRLRDRFGQKQFPSPLHETTRTGFMDDDSWAVQAMSVSDGGASSKKGEPFYQMLRAGPRELLHFDPADTESCAAIVTSGCVCPGENVVIREAYRALADLYGVARIYGIRHGFSGMLHPEEWIELTAGYVQDIHDQAGTVLKNQRVACLPSLAMAECLAKHNVRQLFVLGGDGTHNGIATLYNGLIEINHECAIVGVPSTIDNDISMMDSTFGFDTACEQARNAIDCAYVEATCNANAIGLVKLTGSQSGQLALSTTLASRHVDMCLLPEMALSLEKVIGHCEDVMSAKGYMVIVIADGCVRSLLEDAGENPDGVDVGLWLKDKVTVRFKEKKKPLTIKYIDPTCMIRSTRANAQDSVYCATLAEHAVHGAMAGLTGITTVKIYEQYVYLPIQAVTKAPPKLVNPKGRYFSRMVFTTGQPSLEPSNAQIQSANKDRGDALLLRLSVPLPVRDTILDGTAIQRLECMNLGSTFSSKRFESPLKNTRLGTGAFVKPGSWSTQAFMRRNTSDTKGRTYLQLERAGPRDILHFDPNEPDAAAAIVTCGGLCPGLNSVIRELVKMLNAYGVTRIYGIKGGYKGCVQDDKWILLTSDLVQDIHMHGGSILVSDRGNPPHSEIAKALQRRKVRQYFVLGGDGTHAGAMETFEAMTEIGHECAVVGVPKTIDNDIALLDRSFGFDTAVTEAEKAINCAYVEATTNANCIGFVRLMGRHCGWVALVATLAARHVDICLIPEMTISLPKVLEYAAEVLQRKRYCVIVCAEGCGDTLIQSDQGKDAGGNKLLADVGPFLKDEITKHCKSKGIPVSIKYIDPTYMVRSVPADAFDSMYCSLLAQQAVHAAMAGYTGITVGKIQERYVMLPVHAITGKGPRKVITNGRTFERLHATTKQPSFAP